MGHLHVFIHELEGQWLKCGPAKKADGLQLRRAAERRQRKTAKKQEGKTV